MKSVIEVTKAAIAIEARLYFLNGNYSKLTGYPFHYYSFFDYLAETSAEELANFNICFTNYLNDYFKGNIIQLWSMHNDWSKTFLGCTCCYFVEDLYLAQSNKIAEALLLSPAAEYRPAAKFLQNYPTSLEQERQLTIAILNQISINPSSNFDPDWLNQAFQNFLEENSNYIDELNQAEIVNDNEIYDDDDEGEDEMKMKTKMKTKTSSSMMKM